MKGFRCPDCGQAHRLDVTQSIRVEMNKEMTEKTYFYLDVSVTNENELFDVKDTIQKNPEYNASCNNCDVTNPVHKWMHAFEDPLVYFEMENLCHCGGELWMDQIPGTSSYGFVCEDCNWIKPKAVVSGG